MSGTVNTDWNRRFDRLEQLLTGLRNSVNAQADAIILLERDVNRMSGALQSRLDTLTQEVSELDEVKASVAAFVAGVPDMIREAVAQAQSAGATAEQLAAFDALNTALDAKAHEIASAVAKNTPAEEPGGAAEPVA